MTLELLLIMKISIARKAICFLVFFTYLFSFKELASSSLIPQEIIEQYNDQNEALLTAIKKQFNRLDLDLQELAHNVSNDRIAKIDHKRSVVNEIINLRTTIDLIQKDPFIHITLPMNIKLMRLLNGMLLHVQKSLQQNLTSLVHYDTEKEIEKTFSLPVDIDTVNLENELAKIEATLDAIEYDIKNIGITWFNRIYRKLDSTIIDPAIKNNVPFYAGAATGVLSILLYTWWQTDRGTKPEDQPSCCRANSIPTQDDVSNQLKAGIAIQQPIQYNAFEIWLREKLGAYPHMNSNKGELASDLPTDHHYMGKNPIKPWGHVEKMLWRYTHGFMPAGTYALTPVMVPLVKQATIKTYEVLTKKVFDIHNRLKGGVYSQKAHAQATKSEPRYTFDDIVGLESQKDELRMILRYFEDPERWIRSGLKVGKAFLLTGPTRTGKSFLAEALAGEIRKILKKQGRDVEEFGFYKIDAAFIKKAEGIAAILSAARAQAPCVIFIDEIDLLRLQRSTDADLLSDFLQSLSGALDEDDIRKQVFVIAATNKPQNLDSALLARFTKHISFLYPSFEERKEFFTRRLEGLAVNVSSLNIEKLVFETGGISYQDMEVIIRCAFQRAKIHQRALDQELLEESLDKEIRCIRSDIAKTFRQEEKEIIAAHQAGHVLATILLPTVHRVAKVTLFPVQNKLEEEMVWEKIKKEDEQPPLEHGKMFTYSTNDTAGISSKQEKLNICKIHLAGHIAEEILLGECGYSYHVIGCTKGNSDPERALPFALSIAACGIRLDEKTSAEIRSKIETEAFKILEDCKKSVRLLFEKNKDALSALSKELLEKSTLTGKSVEEIVAKTAKYIPEDSMTKKNKVF